VKDFTLCTELMASAPPDYGSDCGEMGLKAPGGWGAQVTSDLPQVPPQSSNLHFQHQLLHLKGNLDIMETRK